MYQVTQICRASIHCENAAGCNGSTASAGHPLFARHYYVMAKTLVEVDYHAVPGVGIQSDGYVAKTREAALHLKLAYARKIVSGKIDDACWNSVLEIHRSASETTVGVIVRLDRKVAADAYVNLPRRLASQ
jgi:hypothetical protein